jgi:hypothetical protein
MELSQRLNKVAAEAELAGNNDARLAIAACVLLDRNGDVALDGRDLPATLNRLNAQGAVPMWKKFHVSIADVKAGALAADGVSVMVPIITTAPLTAVHGAVIKPTESFSGVGAPTILISVGLGVQVAPLGEDMASMLNGIAGFGDGAGIEDDPAYVVRNLAPATPAFTAAGATITAYVQIPTATSLDDYAALDDVGGFDLWLLISVLP